MGELANSSQQCRIVQPSDPSSLTRGITKSLEWLRTRGGKAGPGEMTSEVIKSGDYREEIKDQSNKPSNRASWNIWMGQYMDMDHQKRITATLDKRPRKSKASGEQ